MPEISDRIGKGDRAKVGRGDPPDVEKPDLMGRDDGNREGHMACSELPEGQCAFEEGAMPEKATLQRVAKDRREGEAPSTQGGAVVRGEIERGREGKHGAPSARPGIASGV